MKRALATRRRCLSEGFVFVLERVLVQRCLHAFRVQTGRFPCFPRRTSVSQLCNRFLIWIGSDQEKTFGPTITGLIYNNIPPDRMILWDTKKRGGRPDTVQLLKDTWTSFRAEVIFITSNMQGNDEMMQGCRAGKYIRHGPHNRP